MMSPDTTLGGSLDLECLADFDKCLSEQRDLRVPLGFKTYCWGFTGSAPPSGK